MNHLSQEELQDHAGGDLPDERAAAAADLHLRTCAECARRIDHFRALERALRSMPLERASEDLSRTVLKRLGIREGQSWLFTLFMNFAPLLALLAVLAVVHFILGRQPAGAPGQNSGEGVRTLFQFADKYSAVGIQSVNDWVGKYLAFMKGRGGLTGFLILFLGAIALLDKYIVMPLIRRRL